MPSVRFPAEWEPHAATWMAWPHDPLTFPSIPDVESVWVRAIREIAKGEEVQLLADSSLHAHIKKMLGKTKNVRLHPVRTADVWLRDTGPIFVKAGKNLRAKCWRFNAWGEKYESHLEDVGLNEKIAAIADVPADRLDMVLEGGSIETNGKGLCLTSEQCLLNKNRNPNLSKSQIEEHLCRQLGFKDFLWLGRGIEGDDTDGHIDDLARFVNGKTIVYAACEDSSDPNFAVLEENRLRLERYARTFKLKLQKIPLPFLEGSEGALPASYMNFYVANACVLVPTFRQRSDLEALSILKEHFPDRKVVGIDCRKVVEGFGAFHCSTQQQPK